MTRQIKKSLLASAVATAMGAGASVATADAILFPYLSKGSTVTTIVTVINRQWGGEYFLNRLLHYSWNYKLPVAGETENALNLRVCDHDNYYRPTSKNDIVTFDAGQVYGDDYNVLFNDPGAGYQGPVLEQRKYNEPFGLANAAWIGYLIVDNDYGIPGDVFENDLGRAGEPAVDESRQRRNQHISLWGEAVSFEWGSGAAWGYEAYNPRGGDSYDFSYRRARNGEVLTGSASDDEDAYRSAIDLVPVGENVDLKERLLVTPVYDDMLRQNLSTKIRIGEPVRYDEKKKASEWYVYDRNEQPWSVNRAPQVTCVGRVTISDPAFWTVSASGGHLKNGGWTFVDPVAPPEFKADTGVPGAVPYVDTEEAIVQKLEFGENAFESTSGLINSAVWLRDFDHD